MTEGNEIRLYDGRRRPACWSNIILPHQCAVFLRDGELGAIGRDGKPRDRYHATCILFDSIDEAESLCRRLVAENPRIACEVLDSGGRENPPLLTIAHDQAHGGDADTRGWIGRHRRTVIAILIAASVPFFWYDSRHDGSLVLTILGINLIVAAMRLLLWDSAAKSNERDRMARVEAFRRESAAPARGDTAVQ